MTRVRDLTADALSKCGVATLADLLLIVAELLDQSQSLCLDIKDFGFEREHELNALIGQSHHPIRASLHRGNRHHRFHWQPPIDVREQLPPAGGLPLHAIAELRQIHRDQHQPLHSAEVPVQRRGKLGTARQVDVAIGDIHRRPMTREAGPLGTTGWAMICLQ